jgi:hypothetical protein
MSLAPIAIGMVGLEFALWANGVQLLGVDAKPATEEGPSPPASVPAEKDLYFPPEDEEIAVGHMPHAELRVIPGVWGHFAGGVSTPSAPSSSTTTSRSCLRASRHMSRTPTHAFAAPNKAHLRHSGRKRGG